jgi:hypothetical protein
MNVFLTMFVGLFGITAPIAAVPLFVSATNGQSNRNRRKASFPRSSHSSPARGTAALGSLPAGSSWDGAAIQDTGLRRRLQPTTVVPLRV